MLKIFAIGNITHDLELRTNPHTGKPVLQFQIASTRLGKGSQVAVTGDLETFPDQDPEQRNYRTIIKAKSIQFLSPRQAERIEADQHPEDTEEVC